MDGEQIAPNKTIDLGNLLLSDSKALENITETSLKSLTLQNTSMLLSHLFKIQLGSEKTDYDTSPYEIQLPEGVTKFPRAKPIPKPKPPSKWEKYRQEKGLNKKQKRSRMVYDEITQDWVPRWGYKSIKHIQEKANWMIEEKPNQPALPQGEDPFAKNKQEKKLNIQKQKLREMKNIMNAKGIKNEKVQENVKEEHKSKRVKEKGEKKDSGI